MSNEKKLEIHGARDPSGTKVAVVMSSVNAPDQYAPESVAGSVAHPEVVVDVHHPAPSGVTAAHARAVDQTTALASRCVRGPMTVLVSALAAVASVIMFQTPR
jgi:hypothetical protein